jgi:TonB family protein
MCTPRVCAVMMVVAAGLLFPSGPSAQDAGGYKIIVNPVNPVTTLSKAQLSNIFLRRTTAWDNGQPVRPVDQAESSPLREAFSRDVLGLSPAAATQQAGAASTEPLLAVASDREVLAYVRLKPGGVGYVSASAPTQGLKVLAFGRSGEAASATGGPQEAIRVGGAVPMPAKVFSVAPIYPPLAKTARTEGVVELELTVGANGSVESVSVIKGVPLITEAAITAVRQWKYAPTVVNGTAVPVKMTTKVNFSLN